MREIIGFHEGDSILAPGGSISNMYALIIARHKFFPEHKRLGMKAAVPGQLVIYTSEQVLLRLVQLRVYPPCPCFCAWLLPLLFLWTTVHSQTAAPSKPNQ